MDITIVKNINYHTQINGMGETVTTFTMIVNLNQVINKTGKDEFILSLTINNNNMNYYYTNIYSVTDIDSNGNLIVGDITVLGNVTEDELQVTARFTYLNTTS